MRQEKQPVLVLTEGERFTLQWLLKMFNRHWGGFPSGSEEDATVRSLRAKLKELEKQQDEEVKMRRIQQDEEVTSLERMLGTGETEGRS